MGISPGGLPSDAEAMGNLDSDRNAMFLECINQVLEIWTSEPPYKIKGEYWNVGIDRTQIPDIGQGRILRPYQKPHPPIVVTAVAPFSKGVAAAAARCRDHRALALRSHPIRPRNLAASASILGVVSRRYPYSDR